MTALFACFPVCMTFVAIGIVGLVVVLIMGTNREGPNAPDDTPPAIETMVGSEPAFPPWWLVVVIFAAVLIHYAVLLLIWPEF